MPATLTVFDETTGGERGDPIVLEFLTEEITIRELIRERVYQEVQDYNLKQATKEPPAFRGLVQPTDAEKTLNGYKLKKPRPIDWQKQSDKAVEAFDANGFMILVNDRQAASLDERVTVTTGTEVSFLKLVPLVGG